MLNFRYKNCILSRILGLRVSHTNNTHGVFEIPMHVFEIPVVTLINGFTL